MEELKKPETKETQESLLLWVKIQTCLTGCLLLLLAAVVGFGAIQAGRAARMLRGLDMDRLNAIVLNLQNAAGELEDLDMETINKTVAALEGAAQNLAQADVTAVNNGIQALSAAAENLQGLDIQQMNELIQSLDAVAKQMEKTTSVFGKLFK